MRIVCLGCKQEMDLPDLAQPQLVNLVATSVLILEHSEQTLCPTCGIPVVPGIMSASLALAGIPVPAQEQKSIIIAPGGSRIN